LGQQGGSRDLRPRVHAWRPRSWREAIVGLAVAVAVGVGVAVRVGVAVAVEVLLGGTNVGVGLGSFDEATQTRSSHVRPPPALTSAPMQPHVLGGVKDRKYDPHFLRDELAGIQ
jgi:hypothetical protein